MLAATRFLLLCAIWLLLSFAPAEASTGEEAITVRPLLGPTGQTVTVTGTGWREHGARGIDVPIWIGFANVVARGNPDVNGEFSVSFTIPSSSPQGKLDISAIIGNGGSADTFYTVADTQPAGCLDVYFIGLHGTEEGPDVLSSDPFVSKVIDETWKQFYSRAKEKRGDNINGCALDYAGSIADLIAGAVDAAVVGLDEYIRDDLLSNCPTQSIVLTGYSLGAWIIDDWLRRNKDVCSSRQPAGNCEDVSPNIVAVELYGDPLWHRKGNAYLGGPVVAFDGLARQLGLHLGNNHDRPDPYTDTHQGLIGLSDLWQSRCLYRDPICGEGYADTLFQRKDAVSKCMSDPNCEHKKYALAPEDPDPPMALGTNCVELPKEVMGSGNQTGYGLSQRGAEFLALKAFPDVLKPGEIPHPKIVFAETFREAEQPLVFFRLFFANPNDAAMGFGFRGVNGSGWAEENHPFSNPSYGRVSPGRIEYPFNLGCGASTYESDVEVWIYDRTGLRSPSITVHLACTAPSEVVTPFPVAPSPTR